MNVPRHIDWGAPALAAAVSGHLLYSDVSLRSLEKMVSNGLCYVATPYSRVTLDATGGWSEHKSRRAGKVAARWCGYLAKAGLNAVSPIVQADQMVRSLGPELLDPLDAEFWTRWCGVLLRASDVVVVPPIEGWQDSQGVWHEVNSALAMNRRVFILAGDR